MVKRPKNLSRTVRVQASLAQFILHGGEGVAVLLGEASDDDFVLVEQVDYLSVTDCES
jgi:hypothetical protein